MFPKLSGYAIKALRYLNTSGASRGARYGTITMETGLPTSQITEEICKDLLTLALVYMDDERVKLNDAGRQWLKAYDELVDNQIREYVYDNYEYALLRYLYHQDRPVSSEEIPRLLEDRAPKNTKGYASMNLHHMLVIELRSFIREVGGRNFELNAEGRKYVEREADRNQYNLKFKALSDITEGDELIKPIVPKDPLLSTGIYKEIILSIERSLRRLEQKHHLYRMFGEEDIRDYIMENLEDRFISTTLTRESFNKLGKTDILLRHTDGTNLFVVECKIWSGQKNMLAAIDQLMGYLTWRDSKAALLLFCRTKDFSSILRTIHDTANSHPLFGNFSGANGESSFSYLFKHADDNEKIIHLEIIAAHFPEQVAG
ncbi:MAG: hypothetical protein J7621_16725 [Niastella sp.]|nr:hypothetical protein [Niastella sp.]